MELEEEFDISIPDDAAEKSRRLAKPLSTSKATVKIGFWAEE